MNFKELLRLTEASRSTEDSFRTTGEALSKDRAKSGASDDKAKDAARKRAERAKQIPRERKPKAELVKEVIAVKTKSGSVQLIFKDSFNKNLHTKIGKGETMTEEEARQLTNDPNFEQTRASKLLFGNVKEKPKAEEKKKSEAPEKEKDKKPETEAGEKEEKKEAPKAKRLSKKEIMGAMTEMTPEQLASMPPDIRKEYFDALRKPMAGREFDTITFENLSTKFGINTLSNTPYNQQVLNALLFVAKIKAGASDQEMQTLVASSGSSLDFTKAAFLQASKILSQIGDACIQNLVSSIEMGNSSMYSEGTPELECGDYKFKISAGGEFSVSTNSLNQNGKIIRGIIGNSIAKTIMDPVVAQNDPNVKKVLDGVQNLGNQFSDKLLPDQAIAQILSDPDLLAQMQSTEVTSPTGEKLGFVVDKDGNINPAVSISAYETSIKKTSQPLFKGGRNNEFLKQLSANVMKTALRGDGLTDPKMAPTHVITANGVFGLTDDYINELSKTAKIDVKRTEEIINNDNISSYKKSSTENLQKWRSVVEAKENKKSIDSLYVDRKKIDPMGIIVTNAMQNLTFDINASLLPGFKPEDINAIEYNYVTIGKKTFKIPVTRTEKISSQILGENYLIINEMLIEALTNNFLLSQLNNMSLINDSEAALILQYGEQLLAEEDLLYGCLIPLLNSINEKTHNDPEYLVPVFEGIISNALIEEAERNYKKEYKNYHGKPKQRKQRAARTAARELMIKKGLVKKGSKKDIDHKKALRHGGSNGINNLRLRDRSENRSDNGHKKGEKQNKDWK